MDFCGYSMDFWLIVVQALSLRCFTLTVRPRVGFVSPALRALPSLLFRRLRVMEAAMRISSYPEIKSLIGENIQSPTVERDQHELFRFSHARRHQCLATQTPSDLIFATPGNGGARDFLEGFTK